MKTKHGYVCDASAVLALLNREPGHERIGEMLADAHINCVNLAEVATKLLEKGLDTQVVKERLSELGMRVVPFDATLAFQTAELRGATRSRGLSLADRACLATAAHLGLPAITTDRIWKKLRLGIDIQVIR